jgi:hypothetical protein
LCASRALRYRPRVFGRVAFAVAAIMLASLGVAQAQTATSLAISQSTPGSPFSAPVTFTATISSVSGTGTPTGTVTFSDGSGTIGSAPAVSGPGAGQAQATLTTSALPVGGLDITATYSGDSNFTGSTGSTFHVVNFASTNPNIISTTPDPNPFGQPSTFLATFTPFAPATATPTGTVTFTVFSFSGGGAISATVPLSGGQATFTVPLLPVGFVGFNANYNGDAGFKGGDSASGTITISPAGTATTLTSSPNPSALNQSVTFTATVSGSAGGTSPTGTVTFTDLTTGQTLGTAPLNNSEQATLTTSSLAAGNHNIQASYGGDNNFGGSTSAPLTQTVNKSNTTATLSSSPNPSVAGQPVTFTAVISPSPPIGPTPAPTGVVTFFSDGNSIGMSTLGSNGQAALTIATLAVGSHTITISYAGDRNFNGSNGGPLTQTVNKNSTTTSVLSSANPSTLGQSVTFTAVLSP